MPKVSAIVPVFNPGSNIDRCIETLLDQSLPSDDYEIIFVDDGSTDETPARLDALAAQHPHVRVEHIPNSGWPGRPRNIGIDMALGEFVYFVDNDDYVGHEALERLYERAVRAGADVVTGKVVGRGKHVPRTVFRESRDDVGLDWRPLLWLLTPHKLFRKALLDEHGIRFPEGRRRLEDHVFTMHAYFHARRIAILADYPCYYWVLHEGDSNASYQTFDAKAYYGNVREVLDLVVEHTDPGPLRDKLLSHWYRGKMLGRVGGQWFPNRTPEARRALYDEVRALADERYGPEVDEQLGWNLRVRSHLLRESTFEALSALAFWEAELRADVTVDGAHAREDGTFVMPFRGRLVGRADEPLRFEARGDRTMWVPPEGLRGEIPDAVLDCTEALSRSTVRVMIRSRDDGTEFVLPTRHELELAPTRDGHLTPVLSGEALVEPDSAAAGARPPAGRWEVLGAVTVCGFTTVGRARSRRMAAEYELRIDPAGAARHIRPAGIAAVKGYVARRLPRLARVLRRAEQRRRRAS